MARSEKRNAAMNKICLIVTTPGTIDSFFIPQLKYLSEHGFDVTVICSPSDTLASRMGENIRFIPRLIPRGVSFRGSLQAISCLKEIFEHEHFDIIQYSTPNAAFYASIAAKRVGCKVRNYHLMGLRYLGASGIGRLVLKTIEKIACANSTSIECVSKSNMEMGIQEGLFPADKVTVVWNGSTGGVDLSRFDYSKRTQWRKEIRKELGYTDDDFVYGFVGRITGDKGINELLQAFFSLETDAKLFLIGRMENEKTLDVGLMEKARNHAGIQFHDSVSDIERYFAAIDVLMLPSYREGFGNVVIESAAMGTPAIVSDIPGPTDAIIREKSALVVPVKEVTALAEAMKRIRMMKYVAMGKDAAKFASENFDSQILCEKILERKRQLLG